MWSKKVEKAFARMFLTDKLVELQGIRPNELKRASVMEWTFQLTR